MHIRFDRRRFDDLAPFGDDLNADPPTIETLMNLTDALIIPLAFLTGAGLATWAWLAVARILDALRTIDGFEGMHLESDYLGASQTESSHA